MANKTVTVCDECGQSAQYHFKGPVTSTISGILMKQGDYCKRCVLRSLQISPSDFPPVYERGGPDDR